MSRLFWLAQDVSTFSLVSASLLCAILLVNSLICRPSSKKNLSLIERSNPSIFPEEILEIIFANLRPEASPTSNLSTGAISISEDRLRLGTLVSLSRANKTFHRLVRPDLYGTLHLRGPKIVHTLLLRTLSTNLHLAHEVRKIVVGDAAWHWKSIVLFGRKSMDAMHDEVSVINSQALRSFSLPHQTKSWIKQGLKNGSEGVDIVCLLAVCRFVETLEFETTNHQRTHCVARLARDCYGKQSESRFWTFLRHVITSIRPSLDQRRLPLSSLHRLAFGTVSKDGWRNSEFRPSAIPLILLPGLDEYHGVDLGLLNQAEDYSIMTLGSSRLTKATFTRTELNEDALAAFLQPCPDLNELNINIRWHKDNQHWNERIRERIWDHFRLINEFGTKLESLEVFCCDRISTQQGNSMAPLINLRNLRSLTVCHGVFCEQSFYPARSMDDKEKDSYVRSLVRRLPAGLEVFSVGECASSFSRPGMGWVIPALLDDTSTRLLKLRRIEVTLSFDSVRERIVATESLKFPQWTMSIDLNKIILQRVR